MLENGLWHKKKSAAYLGISVESLDRYIKKGKIGVIRIGRRCLLKKEMLDEFISSCTIRANNQVTDREKMAMAKAASIAIAKSAAEFVAKIAAEAAVKVTEGTTAKVAAEAVAKAAADAIPMAISTTIINNATGGAS
jgi:excisionase family DNA binding protein